MKERERGKRKKKKRKKESYISWTEEFQVVYVATPPSEMEHNFVLFNCRLYIVTSFQRIEHGKGKQESLYSSEIWYKCLSQDQDNQGQHQLY